MKSDEKIEFWKVEMRNLFLTLTIILLTSPLFGGSHQPANLYRWETVSGIVWKGFGDKDINPQYLGEVDKGKPNGGYFGLSRWRQICGRV